MRGRRRAPGRRLPLCALLLTLASLSCVSKRVDVSLATLPPSPYSSSVHVALALGRHGFYAPGGCAVDPARGVRMELRDPSGSSRLLLLLLRDRAELISLRNGLTFSWSSATEEMPFSSADLWFLFTGTHPEGLRALRSTGEGFTYAEWKNSRGRFSCRLVPAPTPPPIYQTADLIGPGGTQLRLTFKNTKSGDFPDTTFASPPGLTPIAAPLAQVIQEASP